MYWLEISILNISNRSSKSRGEIPPLNSSACCGLRVAFLPLECMGKYQSELFWRIVLSDLGPSCWSRRGTVMLERQDRCKGKQYSWSSRLVQWESISIVEFVVYREKEREHPLDNNKFVFVKWGFLTLAD